MSYSSPQQYQGQKIRVRITACDSSQRLIHGELKDGGSMSIAVWEVDAAFRWPIVGEVWTVMRQNNLWILGSRVNFDPAETFPITTISGNQVRLDGGANGIFDNDGNTAVTVTQSGIMDGDFIAWNADQQRWLPAQPSGTPGGPIVWTPLVFTTNYFDNPWSPKQPPAAWALDSDGFVHLRGGAGCSVNWHYGDIIANLPLAAQPTDVRQMMTYASDDNNNAFILFIWIEPNGRILIPLLSGGGGGMISSIPGALTPGPNLTVTFDCIVPYLPAV